MTLTEESIWWTSVVRSKANAFFIIHKLLSLGHCSCPAKLWANSTGHRAKKHNAERGRHGISLAQKEDTVSPPDGLPLKQERLKGCLIPSLDQLHCSWGSFSKMSPLVLFRNTRNFNYKQFWHLSLLLLSKHHCSECVQVQLPSRHG